MKHSKFDIWSENKLKAEFTKANAEIIGLIPKKNDAYQRKQKIAMMLSVLKRT